VQDPIHKRFVGLDAGQLERRVNPQSRGPRHRAALPRRAPLGPGGWRWLAIDQAMALAEPGRDAGRVQPSGTAGSGIQRGATADSFVAPDGVVGLRWVASPGARARGTASGPARYAERMARHHPQQLRDDDGLRVPCPDLELGGTA
jgi:hypothetical protein